MSVQQEQRLREKFTKAIADHFCIEDDEPALRPAETPFMMVGDTPRQYEAFQVLGIELANLIEAQGVTNTAPDLMAVAQKLKILSDDSWNNNRLCWTFKNATEAAGIQAETTAATASADEPAVARVHRNDSRNPFSRMPI